MIFFFIYMNKRFWSLRTQHFIFFIYKIEPPPPQKTRRKISTLYSSFQFRPNNLSLILFFSFFLFVNFNFILWIFYLIRNYDINQCNVKFLSSLRPKSVTILSIPKTVKYDVCRHFSNFMCILHVILDQLIPNFHVPCTDQLLGQMIFKYWWNFKHAW